MYPVSRGRFVCSTGGIHVHRIIRAECETNDVLVSQPKDVV